MAIEYYLFFQYRNSDREFFDAVNDLNADEVQVLVEALTQHFDSFATGFKFTAFQETELDPVEYVRCRMSRKFMEREPQAWLAENAARDQIKRRNALHKLSRSFRINILNRRDLLNDSEIENTCPKYDSERRELWIGETLVKRFKQKAVNQEFLLNVFQEHAWKTRIDNPFPPRQPRVLSETVRGLNRHMKHRMIEFELDGTGEGVIWRRIAPT